MTKKEKEAMEDALTAAALRTTGDVFPDVPPPTIGGARAAITTGWDFVGASSDSGRVDLACSSLISHGIGSHTKTSSQGSRALYSTRTLALKALRRATEKVCAIRLRRIDRMIEQAQENGEE